MLAFFIHSPYFLIVNSDSLWNGRVFTWLDLTYGEIIVFSGKQKMENAHISKLAAEIWPDSLDSTGIILNC